MVDVDGHLTKQVKEEEPENTIPDDAYPVVMELNKMFYDYSYKYQYIIIALSAASVAFAVQQLVQEETSLFFISTYALFLATLCWCMSILMGLKSLHSTIQYIYNIYELYRDEAYNKQNKASATKHEMYYIELYNEMNQNPPTIIVGNKKIDLSNIESDDEFIEAVAQNNGYKKINTLAREATIFASYQLPMFIFGVVFFIVFIVLKLLDI